SGKPDGYIGGINPGPLPFIRTLKIIAAVDTPEGAAIVCFDDANVLDANHVQSDFHGIAGITGVQVDLADGGTTVNCCVDFLPIITAVLERVDPPSVGAHVDPSRVCRVYGDACW